MPILELFPKPAQNSGQPDRGNTAGTLPPPTPGGDQPESASSAPEDRPTTRAAAIKVRTGRFGELEEHELIHLLDSLDDERSRARFRESIYISVIIYLAVAWFLFYGPRVLWHQPVLRDPIALMKQRDKELTYITPTAPAFKPPPRPVIDRSTMQKLQQQVHEAPPTPQPPAPQPAPPPQEEARVTPPPVPQPPAPLPVAPKAAQPAIEAPLPAAPRPSFAQNAPSAGDAIRQAAQNALRGRSGADIGAPGAGGPLQAGATILTDTQGVDFSAYLRRLHDDIQRNWNPLIPEEVQPPLLKKGVVGIRFTILADGELSQPMILETTSGDVALDKAAWYAITSEGQFPPLPRQFHGPQIELRVGFFYNEPIRQ
jgi:outer membrane biosynthesis protein TonB